MFYIKDKNDHIVMVTETKEEMEKQIRPTSHWQDKLIYLENKVLLGEEGATEQLREHQAQRTRFCRCSQYIDHEIFESETPVEVWRPEPTAEEISRVALAQLTKEEADFKEAAFTQMLALLDSQTAATSTRTKTTKQTLAERYADIQARKQSLTNGEV
jgi:hypothetical protein